MAASLLDENQVELLADYFATQPDPAPTIISNTDSIQFPAIGFGSLNQQSGYLVA